MDLQSILHENQSLEQETWNGTSGKNVLQGKVKRTVGQAATARGK